MGKHWPEIILALVGLVIWLLYPTMATYRVNATAKQAPPLAQSPKEKPGATDGTQPDVNRPKVDTTEKQAPPGEWESTGQLGDTYGGFTALVSMFAVIAAFVAYRVQSAANEAQYKAIEAQENAHRTQLEQIRQERKHELLQMFLRFEEDFLRSVRQQAWQARSKWYRLPEAERNQFRYDVLATTVPQELGEAIPDVGTAHGSEESRAVGRLLNFYCALSELACEDDQLQRVAFYFGYWRGFLGEYVAEYERRFNELPEAQRLMLGHQPWRDGLDRLAKRLNLPAYEPNDDPMLVGLKDDLAKGQNSSNSLSVSGDCKSDSKTR